MIKFRFDEDDDKAEIWDDTLVQGVTFHSFEIDIKYEYLKTSKDERFPLLLEVLTEGEITLYVDVFDSKIFLPTDGVSLVSVSTIALPKMTRIYLKRDNEEFPTRLKGRFKKSVIAYFGNCIGLIKRIDNHEFRRYTIKEMVEYYNNYCTD